MASTASAEVPRPQAPQQQSFPGKEAAKRGVSKGTSQHPKPGEPLKQSHAAEAQAEAQAQATQAPTQAPASQAAGESKLQALKTNKVDDRWILLVFHLHNFYIAYKGKTWVSKKYISTTTLKILNIIHACYKRPANLGYVEGDRIIRSNNQTTNPPFPKHWTSDLGEVRKTIKKFELYSEYIHISDNFTAPIPPHDSAASSVQLSLFSIAQPSQLQSRAPTPNANVLAIVHA